MNNNINFAKATEYKNLKEWMIFKNTNNIENFPVWNCVFLWKKKENGSNVCDTDTKYIFKHLKTWEELEAPTLYWFEYQGYSQWDAIKSHQNVVKENFNFILKQENNDIIW
jgi:hypothetical protein